MKQLKSKEIDFTVMEKGKAYMRDTVSLLVKHDRRGIFVVANIIIYYTFFTLAILKLFGVI